MYETRVQFFYRFEMSIDQNSANYSRSPEKPRLFFEYLQRNKTLKSIITLNQKWQPYEIEDFKIAHSPEYIDSFFKGHYPLCESSGLAWSHKFAESLRYTNASLYHAIHYAVSHPATICYAPVSGFHHATFHRGAGFCTFSGQVIASVKLWRELGVRGAYIDLDGHFGNSIEESYRFIPELKEAIPKGCNINPEGLHSDYLYDLQSGLSQLEADLLTGDDDYVVMCHGADSHEDDDLGGQLSTAEWLQASEMVYGMIKRVSVKRNQPVPLIICLFGGYRSDNFNFVLDLHCNDLQIAVDTLISAQKENAITAQIRHFFV